MTDPDTISVTVKHARELTGLSHTTIYKLIGLGRIRTAKIGRRTLISYASLRELLEPGVFVGQFGGRQRGKNLCS